MTISAHRSLLIWTPLLGWALLMGSVAGAQTPPASGTPTATTEPAAPTGGGGVLDESPSPTVVAPDGTTPLGVTPLGPTGGTPAAGTPGGQVKPLELTPVQELPSATQTIVGAPFGTTVPITIAPGGGPGAPRGELGFGVGSFDLYPAIELTAGYDSNVFAQSAAQGTTASPFTVVSPSLALRSDWLNHAVNVVASGGFGFYAAAPTQNYQNYALIADGKVDILSDFYLTWTLGYRQITEPLGTPNTTQAFAPTVVDNIPLGIGLYQKFNRFYYELRGTATSYSITQNQVITSAILPNEDQNRWEYGETLRLGYEIYEDLSVWVQPGLNQVRYLNTLNSLGQNRNSDGQVLSIGTTWKPNETTSLDASVGYQNTTGVTTATSGLIFGLSGNWNGYSPLTVRPTFSRSVQQTPLSNYVNYVQSVYGVDVTYLIHDAWTATGGLYYSTSNYTAAPGFTAATAPPRTDSFFRGQIGLLYSLRPQVQIGPLFEYSNGRSTDPVNGPMYDREIFSIRLIARR